MSSLKRHLKKYATDSGVLSTALRWKKGSPLILMYHGVSGAKPNQNSISNCEHKHISREIFAEQLKSIRKSRRVIPLEHMVEGIRNGDDMQGTLALTFDDGYENNFLHAAPILADFGMPAAFFLTTGLIGTERCTWSDTLEMLLDRTKAQNIFVPQIARTLPLNSVETKRETLRRIKPMLKKLPQDQTKAIIEELVEQLRVSDLKPDGDYRFMNWRQAQEMVNGGFELGAHTVNHFILSQISHAQAEREILGSRDEIVKQLGRCSTTFCYPNGKSSDYTESIVEVCRQHFRAAVSTQRGVAHRDDLYELNRFGAPTEAQSQGIEWLLLTER